MPIETVLFMGAPTLSWVSSHRLRLTSESEFLPKGEYTENNKEGPSMGSTWE